jgi:hypothetical protein
MIFSGWRFREFSMPMDGSTSREILRLHRIEQWAKAQFKKAWDSNNVHRLRRAAQLEEAAASRANAIAMAEVRPYRD